MEEGPTEVGVIPTQPDDPFYPGAFVCEAFQQDDPVTDVFQGLVGQIFYLTQEQRAQLSNFTSVGDYLDHGTAIDQVSLYFNTINIPTRPFDRGFQTSDGEVLKTERGDTLYEYFAFRIQTDFMLAPGEQSGLYEMAVLSDDGSLLYLDNDVIVDNDGDHPTQMGCAQDPVYLEAGERYPMKFEYYQGPKYHIAAIILYRPYDPLTGPDTECGKQGNDRYFDSRNDPPTPQPAYTGLLARGWQVAQPENYKVPLGIMNMCNFPAPNLSAIEFAELGSNHISLKFETNVPSIHKILLTDLSAGEEKSTEWSKDYYKQHRVEMAGLKSFTLYNMEIFVESPSGRLTRSAPVLFRTRQ